ncbi:hypothetical protein CCICO_01245 [Corynebacterium ciconiae DSM 44920]|uniref:3'-5' exonuclease n=1 Tax=Corynebacterium ciconiae TaxID=227319 RepID=UPI0003A50FA6|nr:3'-5' exonuclease [Corynebacterium ciconiae]WKD60303.1 hypothetical protein CCICO_01245 [Corynebacterium ciconiae DSM 44920]
MSAASDHWAESTEVEFAVIDLETTGLGASDRVVEIGVVISDAQGHLLQEWDSLIQPARPIPTTPIHGISEADVIDAPRFDEVAAEVAALLHGRVLVAHNAPFDLYFLQREYAALGVEFQPHSGQYLDTCVLGPAAYPTSPSRSLHSLLKVAGITNSAAHTALADARATAELLAACMQRVTLSHEGEGVDCTPALGPQLKALARPRYPRRRR